MKQLGLLMRLDRYELFGINRRMHDPARRFGGKWLLALVVLAAISAVGVAFAYCMASPTRFPSSARFRCSR